MDDKELERRATALTLALGKAMDAPEDVLARAMDRFPDLILTEMRRVRDAARECAIVEK